MTYQRSRHGVDFCSIICHGCKVKVLFDGKDYIPIVTQIVYGDDWFIFILVHITNIGYNWQENSI